MDVTKKTNLREFRPVWAATRNHSVSTGPLPQRSEFDVIVVGAGISAALMTTLLAKPGRRILVVDRRAPVQGSTMASTAMIQHEIDIPLSKLSRAIGKEKAARAWRRSAAAVGDLSALLERHGIDCGFQEKATLYLTGDDMGFRAMRQEAEMRAEIGLDCAYLDRKQLAVDYGIQRSGAIRSNYSAGANPAQMTAGLFNALSRRDVTISADVEIKDYRDCGREVVVSTGDGRLLAAGSVVFCTGYEFLRPMQSSRHRVLATWALATAPDAPRPSWLDTHIVWEASDPYLYFRSTPDGRIIAGGEDEVSPDTIDDPQKMREKAELIREKLGTLLGQRIPAAAYRWAARFGSTDDGLPIIDRVPGCERVYSVMGFGGNGITFSMIAAQIVERWISGHDHADADLFAFR